MFFLLLLCLWLRTTVSDYADLPEVSDGIPWGNGGASPPAPMSRGGGGQFGADGAGRSFDHAAGVSLNESAVAEPLGKTLRDGASSIADADADAYTVPLVVILLALGLALASLDVVSLARFAEILFDGALSYSLYRHLRGVGSSHWMGTALRRTVLPFGIAMAAYAPGARTLGEVMHQGQVKK